MYVMTSFKTLVSGIPVDLLAEVYLANQTVVLL